MCVERLDFPYIVLIQEDTNQIMNGKGIEVKKCLRDENFHKDTNQMMNGKGNH